MAKKYFVFYFSGHSHMEDCGKRDHGAFRKLEPLLKLGDVSRFAYYSGLGLQSSDKVAASVMGEVLGYAGGSIDAITFIVYGYSAGGITALRFANKIPGAQLVYIALSDAAFYRGETDFMMRTPGVLAYHKSDNYYQTYENSPNEDEIHDKITADGWDNYRIAISENSIAPWNNYHSIAISRAFPKIFQRMKNIINNDI